MLRLLLRWGRAIEVQARRAALGRQASLSTQQPTVGPCGLAAHEGHDVGTVTIADSTADPWWDRLPTTNWVEQGPIKPVSGTPEEIASALLEYRAEGIAHIQICLEPTTPQAAEAFAPALEIVHRTTSGRIS